MTERFDNQVVILGGGVGELGSAVTHALVERGATVWVPFISELKLNIFLTDYPKLRDVVHFWRVDLTRADAVADFVAAVMRHSGRIDVVINLSGGYRGGLRVAESTREDYDAMLDINFTTVHTLARAVLPHMLEAGRGSIVSVGSAAGLRATAGHAAYAVAKAAVIRFTEALSEEVKHQGVRANCVLPTVLDTRRNRMDMPDADPNTWVKLGDLAEVILFLASERARAIHGAAIPVSGRV